jgi:hypothetical protein
MRRVRRKRKGDGMITIRPVAEVVCEEGEGRCLRLQW